MPRKSALWARKPGAIAQPHRPPRTVPCSQKGLGLSCLWSGKTHRGRAHGQAVAGNCLHVTGFLRITSICTLSTQRQIMMMTQPIDDVWWQGSFGPRTPLLPRTTLHTCLVTREGPSPHQLWDKTHYQPGCVGRAKKMKSQELPQPEAAGQGLQRVPGYKSQSKMLHYPPLLVLSVVPKSSLLPLYFKGCHLQAAPLPSHLPLCQFHTLHIPHLSLLTPIAHLLWHPGYL